jgi:hypothetical protein
MGATLNIMICKKCGFEMIGKPIDSAVTIWKCPLGHRYVEWRQRESITSRSTYPHNMETK